MNIDIIAASRRLRSLREEKRLSQSEVASRIGVHKSTVLRWEKGEGLSSMKTPVWEELASIYGCTADYLIYGSTETRLPRFAIKPEKTVDIPILGSVRAGVGGAAVQDIVGYSAVEVSSLTRGETYFWLRVEGDSMMPKIESGDLVLVRQQTSVDSGSYAVVIVDDEEGLVKCVGYGKNWIELHSVNPYYPVRRFEGENVTEVTVVGLVVEIKRRLA